MPSPVQATLVALLMLALPGLVACQRDTTPPLIEVTAVAPREVEAGDHLILTGVGFPEGKTAHVGFHGDLYRPATDPVRGVEIDVDAIVTSATEIEVPMNDALERQFVGAGERAAHTTFSGDISVAFAARSPAAPPVSGGLRDVWLDVRPPTPHRAVAEAESAAGVRTLAFVGITPRPTPVAAGGIRIESIEPASRAESARLLPGDVITEIDGVRVLSTRDLVVASGERTAWLKVRRDGSPREEIAQLSLVGLAPPPATALLRPVLVLGLAAVLLLFFCAPTPTLASWLDRLIALRVHARAHDQRRGRMSAPFGSAAATWTVVAAVSATLAFLPLARTLGAPDLDVGILFIVAATSLATLGLVTGGSRGPYSLVRGLRVALRVISLEIPVAAGVVAVVVLTGSLRLDDIVAAQGGWPWHWTVFENPLAFGLLAVWLVAALVESERGHDPLPEAEGPSRFTSFMPAPSGRSRLFSLAARANLLVTCGVAAALFLGGWQIPGFATEQVEAHVGLRLLGVLLFVIKAWGLVALVVAARAVLPPLRSRQVLSLTFRWLAPVSLLLLLLTTVWVAWGPGPSSRALIGAVMLALTCATALHVVARVRQLLGDAAAAPKLDPFL